MKTTLGFALGFVFGVFFSEPRALVTVYYPRTTYAQGLDERRMIHVEWNR